MKKPIEIITIVKIREGFFIGDLSAGTNIEIIEEYKITHIINATNNKNLNEFEKKGIKYLTLNWLENSNQQLFTLNDEVLDVYLYLSSSNEAVTLYSPTSNFLSGIVTIPFSISKI